MSLMNTLTIGLRIGVLLLFTCSFAAAKERPNIVIVLADDMGYGDAGCYNANSKCPTPNIDALAAAGMRFTDAHAAGAWCTPSRYGLLTGRYAFRTSLKWQEQPVIAAGVKTIGDTLRTAGYATAMVGKWHLGFDNAKEPDFSGEITGGPCDRGFDDYFGLPASLDIPDFYWIEDRSVPNPPTVPIADSNSDPKDWNPIQGRFWRGGKRGADFEMEACLDRIGTEAAKRIDSLSGKEQPFFLYVPLTSPHTPWLPSEKYATANGAGEYSQFVAHTDAILGQILAALRANKIEQETLVIFTSDNGPVWYEFDTKRYGHDSMGGWRGMKGDVWEAGHRVPFVVRWPGKVKAGSSSDQLLSFVDLHATLADLVGATLPDSAVDGKSFAGVWQGTSSRVVRTELVSFQTPIVLRTGKWKLITRPGSSGFLAHDRNGNPFLSADVLNPDLKDGKETEGQLYDLANDPAEATNLWSSRRDVVKQLSSRLKQLAGE